MRYDRLILRISDLEKSPVTVLFRLISSAIHTRKLSRACIYLSGKLVTLSCLTELMGGRNGRLNHFDPFVLRIFTRSISGAIPLIISCSSESSMVFMAANKALK